MGHYEDIKIDRSEGWKYQSTHGTNGDDYHARVYVDDKGKISKDSYSREYNKRLEPSLWCFYVRLYNTECGAFDVLGL